jgi:hypothetical protein
MSQLANPLVDADALYPPLPVQSYRDVRAELRQYEGARAQLCSFAGGALCLPFAATPPGVLALSIFVVHGGLVAYVVGLVSLCTTWLPGLAYRARLWERPVRDRLTWRSTFDPSVARVSVNIAERDIGAAWRVIRRAGLIVEYTRTLGHVGAEPRNTTIAVAQWAYRRQLDDFAFRDAVCEVFGSAGMWANVGGIEVNAAVAKPP